MKTRLFSTLAAAIVLACSGISTTQAQEPVSTGIINDMQINTGMLTLRADQNQRLITFYGVDKANAFTADGQPAKMADMQVGQRVTVQYATRDGKWYISKVILPDQRATAAANAAAAAAAPAAASAPAAAAPTTAAGNAPITATDGDRTTQPGRKAAVDGDITTQPTDTGLRRSARERNSSSK